MSTCLDCGGSRERRDPNDGELETCTRCSFYCRHCDKTMDKSRQAGLSDWCSDCLDKPVTVGELMTGGSRPCRTCWWRPALVGEGSALCDECRERAFPTKYAREESEDERRVSDEMEASGASLEPSCRNVGGGGGYGRPGDDIEMETVSLFGSRGWGKGFEE